MTVLGIDYGTKHIGVAISDEDGTLARPLAEIDNTKTAIAAIVRTVRDQEVQVVVLGVPFPSKRQGSLLVRAVEEFARELKASLPIVVPVKKFNEAYTTKRARQKLEEAPSANSVSEHSAAATEILQNYLDRERKGLTE